MKVINRPMSTSHVMEFPFHYIKDQAESDNIKKLIDGKNTVHVMDRYDPESARYLRYFAVEDANKPFAEWFKYVTTMSLSNYELTIANDKV